MPASFVRRAIITLGFSLTACLLFCQGCRSSQDARANLPRSASTVSQEAGYRKAQVLFNRHDYRGAIAGIDTLLAAPNRSEADRKFLRRQREICQRSLSGDAALPAKTVVVPTSPAVSPSDADCGPRALLLLCREAKLPVTLPLLSKTAGVSAPRGTSLEGLGRAARSVGFVPLAVQMDRDALANLSTPAIAWVDGNHYVAVHEVKRSLRGITYDTVVIHDPNKPGKEAVLLTDLLSRSGGVLLTLKTPEKRLARASS